jgi:hypothetical protein
MDELGLFTFFVSLGLLSLVSSFSYMKEFSGMGPKRLWGCLDCGRWLPFQNICVDCYHVLPFGLKPNYRCHAKILVDAPISAPTRRRNMGGQIVRQNFGLPLIWYGVRGHKPNSPYHSRKCSTPPSKKKNAAHSNFQVQNTLYAFSFFIALISIVLCKCLLQRPWVLTSFVLRLLGTVHNNVQPFPRQVT